MSVLDADGVLADEVIGAEQGWVFVPCRRLLGPGDPVRPELRRLADGRLALLAYTSLTELVAGCGRHQSWVLVPADWFEQIRAECHFDTIVLNADVPQRWRQEAETWPGRPEDWDE
jgi:hypothetical protein